jgi:hypothetical protein
MHGRGQGLVVLSTHKGPIQRRWSALLAWAVSLRPLWHDKKQGLVLAPNYIVGPCINESIIGSTQRRCLQEVTLNTIFSVTNSNRLAQY